MDEVRKCFDTGDTGDAVDALEVALRDAGARQTFDRHRSTVLPCYLCSDATTQRVLVSVGIYTRRMGGNLQPGDRIERPLCSRCVEATVSTASAASAE